MAVIFCRKCLDMYDVPDESIGQVLKCRKCDARVTVANTFPSHTPKTVSYKSSRIAPPPQRAKPKGVNRPKTATNSSIDTLLSVLLLPLALAMPWANSSPMARFISLFVFFMFLAALSNNGKLTTYRADSRSFSSSGHDTGDVPKEVRDYVGSRFHQELPSATEKEIDEAARAIWEREKAKQAIERYGE
jgi:hypothetical protein